MQRHSNTRPSAPLALFFIAALATKLFAQEEEHLHSPLGIYGCQFHAYSSFMESIDSAAALDLSTYTGLMNQAADLESQLIQLDTSSGVWTEERAQVLLELATARRVAGETTEARALYEDVLLNIRVNKGIHALEQLPILFDLMAWYMTVDEEYTDQLAERAAYLFEQAYTTDQQLPNLVAGYTRLLELRQQAQVAMGQGDSQHAQKAAELGRKIGSLLEKLFSLDEPTLIAQLRGDSQYFTRYDDFGKSIATPQPGIQQVSDHTGSILKQVQALMRPENPEQEPDYTRAKRLLDDLNSNYAQLKAVDQAALMDFFGDYYLVHDDSESAIAAYKSILAIRVLRPDYQLRSLRILGQLLERQKHWRDSIETYSCWRQLSEKEDARVSLGLAKAYREIGELERAIFNLEQYMEVLARSDEIAEKSLYVALKDMYYETGDLDSGAAITRVIVSLFD